MRAFWHIAPCNLVGVGRRFRDAYCLHNYPDDGLLQRDYTAIFLRLSAHKVTVADT
jgi:hypothetical protein